MKKKYLVAEKCNKLATNERKKIVMPYRTLRDPGLIGRRLEVNEDVGSLFRAVSEEVV